MPVPDCSDLNAVYNYYLAETGCPYQASYKTGLLCGHHDSLAACCGGQVGSIDPSTVGNPSPYYSYCYAQDVYHGDHPACSAGVQGSEFEEDYNIVVVGTSPYTCYRTYRWEGVLPNCPSGCSG